MNNFKAILIDDELVCLDVLKTELELSCPEVSVKALCSSAKEGLIAFNKLKPNLIFLDIDMPYIDGFEFIELLPSLDNVDIIFVTAHNDFAIKAIRSCAADYLLKPINGNQLSEAIERLKNNKISKLNPNYAFIIKQIQNIRDDNFSKVALTTSSGIEMVNLNEVIYCKAFDNYTYIYRKQKVKLFITKPISYIEEVFSDPFFRCHRSYIINIKCITHFNKIEGTVLTINDDTIPVSRRRRRALLNILESI